MKYFTEEWHRDTILAEMCFQVRKNSKASKFSEKYFQLLYADQKKWYIRHLKHAARFMREKFDADKAGAEFDANYHENLEFVQNSLPLSILNNVKDIRVLALGVAEHDVVQEITRFCGQVNRRCESVRAEYDRTLEELAEEIGWYKINSLNMLANAPVEKIDGENTIVIETSNIYTDIACRVIFTDAQTQGIFEEIVGSTVRYFEILKGENEKKYQLNMLCERSDGSFVSLSIQMNDIDIEEI